MADGQARPAAGNRPSNPMPATPPTGSPAACRKPGSTATRTSLSIARRSPSSAGCPTRTVTRAKARASGRVSRFREDTRAERMRIADEAEDRFGRKVSWGVDVGSGEDVERVLFTHLAIPVMTRLRQPERQVLDTLVDAGVARSRSDALAWSVKLVGEHTEEWLTKLRDAMRNVDELRSEGPQV